MSNGDKIREMSKRYAEVTGQEEPFMYSSHPGDGQARYVFQGKTCLGFSEAERYMLHLMIDAEVKGTT